METCPQYLLLDRSYYENPNYSQAARYVCAPPLREKADQEALWAALADGTIQTISTDHCSFTLAQKDAGKGDFTQIPGGLPGVESRGILLWSEGVARGRIDAARMCAPALRDAGQALRRLPPEGRHRPRQRMPISWCWTPRPGGLLTAADQAANVDYCPYEGWVTQGVIDQVYLRGQLAVDHGQILTGPVGQYIPRKL